jgi:hypothetical protein
MMQGTDIYVHFEKANVIELREEIVGDVSACCG